MVSILELWLPILLSAVFVFVASSVMHMLLPIHRSDWKQVDGEEDVLKSMRGAGVKPGEYMFPFPKDMKCMNSPEMLEKLERGPVGFMTVFPNGPMRMGKSLVQWLVYCLVVGSLVAYIASIGLKAGSPFVDVFRLVTTAALLAHAVTQVTHSIWKGQCWLTTAKFIFDGVVYALITAATFAWLWPAAA